jgi:hypothetical protein
MRGQKLAKSVGAAAEAEAEADEQRVSTARAEPFGARGLWRCREAEPRACVVVLLALGGGTEIYLYPSPVSQDWPSAAHGYPRSIASSSRVLEARSQRRSFPPSGDR